MVRKTPECRGRLASGAAGTDARPQAAHYGFAGAAWERANEVGHDYCFRAAKRRNSGGAIQP